MCLLRESQGGFPCSQDGAGLGPGVPPLDIGEIQGRAR